MVRPRTRCKKVAICLGLAMGKQQALLASEEIRGENKHLHDDLARAWSSGAY